MIQTIRAADLDNFANGKFSFYVPPEHQMNPNFTVKDNGGKTLGSKSCKICADIMVLCIFDCYEDTVDQ